MVGTDTEPGGLAASTTVVYPSPLPDNPAAMRVQLQQQHGRGNTVDHDSRTLGALMEAA